MYGMNIVVIGCDARIICDVRREALNHLATIEAEFSDLPSALHGIDATGERVPHVHRAGRVDCGAGTIETNQRYIYRTTDSRAVDADKDASMVVKAMRAGAIQVVLLPFQRADFGAVLDCIAVQFGLAPARATRSRWPGIRRLRHDDVAINLAYEIAFAKRTQRVLMVALHSGWDSGKLPGHPATIHDVGPPLSTRASIPWRSSNHSPRSTTNCQS